MNAQGGRTNFSYGPLGEVVKEVRVVNNFIASSNPTLTTLYAYDTWNRLQRLTYSDGEVQKITELKQGISYPYVTFLGYHKFGAREWMG